MDTNGAPRLRDHLSPRRERALFAAIGFAVALGIARGITTVLHERGAGANGGIVIGGLHLHHYLFGLAAVMVTGFLWMQEVGIGDGRSVWASRLTSIVFGVGAALILDEFALLVNLRDVYWQRQGRSSIEVAAAFGSALVVAALAHPFSRARWRANRERRR